MKCFIPNKFNFTIDYSKHDFQDVHETINMIMSQVAIGSVYKILVKIYMFHEVMYHAYQIIENLNGLINIC